MARARSRGARREIGQGGDSPQLPGTVALSRVPLAFILRAAINSIERPEALFQPVDYIACSNGGSHQVLNHMLWHESRKAKAHRRRSRHPHPIRTGRCREEHCPQIAPQSEHHCRPRYTCLRLPSYLQGNDALCSETGLRFADGWACPYS